MEKRENWKTTKSLHAAFDAVVMVAKGTAENSRQLLLALLGGRLGCRLPLPHLTDRRRGVRRCLEGRGKQKHTGVLDTDERKKNLFREPGERDICKEERRRGLSASKQTSVKLDCKPGLGTRGPISRGLGFEEMLPASSCVCRDAHVVCC